MLNLNNLIPPKLKRQNQKISEGINIIIFNEYNSENDNLIEIFKKYINLEYAQSKHKYSRSLIYNELDEKIIKKYSEIIDINNNLPFRKLYNSLIPRHQEYLKNKYKNIFNLKNFFLFPSSDKNFICLLYSLIILKNNSLNLMPLFSDNFFYIFDNLTLTSACNLLKDYSIDNKNFTFISTTYSDSSFVKEYKKFYNFNYIYI